MEESETWKNNISCEFVGCYLHKNGTAFSVLPFFGTTMKEAIAYGVLEQGLLKSDGYACVSARDIIKNHVRKVV